MAMLTPNQIKSQTFQQVSRGAYRAADVDAYLQRVSYSVADLMQENAELKNKFAALSGVVEEYNAGKNAIATALVKAQALADQTTEAAKSAADQVLFEATENAQRILAEKTEEADAYAKEKKESADRYYEKMHSELQRIMSEAEARSKQYAEEVNAQASGLIADANEKAAMIVAAAYKDAQDARDKTDEIIAQAKVEIETTKRCITAFRSDAGSVLQQLLDMIEGISLDEYDAANAFGNSTSIPDVTPEAVEAPKLSLSELFEFPPQDTEPEETPAAPEEAPAIAEDAILEPNEPIFTPEEAPAAPQEIPAAPIAPDIPPAFDPDRTVALPTLDIDQPSLFDYAPPEPPAQQPVDAAPTPVEPNNAPAPADDVPLFTYRAPKPEPTPEPVDEAPTESFKFHLTKPFDIFDD